MKLSYWFLSLCFSFVLWSCHDQSHQKTISPKPTENKKRPSVKAVHGMIVFKHHCKGCHTAPHSSVLDGTHWDGLFDRTPGGEKFVKDFISSSSSLRNDSNANAYAIALKEEYGYMSFEHEFAKQLSKEELQNLMAYLKEEIEKRDSRY